MDKINANKLGLVLGILLALVHFLWILIIASGFAKQFLDYVLSLHFISDVYSIGPFGFGTAAILLIFTFVSGYVIGFAFAMIWNMLKV
ncbi:hypothetical protein HY449_04105 [Candidatus Pacearchaeota archaeon]|nr:hypothetical protein [Candidatus Pacearchaeota archaeon]